LHGDERVERGSGMFVGPRGVATNHHFLPADHGTAYEFSPGDYRLLVVANLVGMSHAVRLGRIDLHVSANHASQLGEGQCGLFFDWAPDSRAYKPSIVRLTERGAATFAS
jgi:hypothetical protein